LAGESKGEQRVGWTERSGGKGGTGREMEDIGREFYCLRRAFNLGPRTKRMDSIWLQEEERRSPGENLSKNRTDVQEKEGLHAKQGREECVYRGDSSFSNALTKARAGGKSLSQTKRSQKVKRKKRGAGSLVDETPSHEREIA